MNSREALRHAAKRLEVCTPDAWFEAKELLLHLLGCDEIALRRGDLILDEAALQRLNILLDRRLAGEPLQYLIGNWDFFGMTLVVGPGVLIPRADTETLVEACLAVLEHHPAPKILDLCAGSGCIALALAKHLPPQAQIFALEKEDEAFSYLTKNIALQHSAVRAVQDDALAPAFAEGEFDLIVSNPPYLSEADRCELQRELHFEPETALFDGGDGLHFYRTIPRVWRDRLKTGGRMAFEIGIHQEQAVLRFLQQHGFTDCQTVRDLGNIIRVVIGKKK